MNFKLTIQVGQTTIEIADEASTQTEFFQRVSFWTSLPAVGPNGEDDLRIVARRTRKNHIYYSIASPTAGQELRFGVHNDETGRLYPKQWEPIMYGQHAHDEGDYSEEDRSEDRSGDKRSGDDRANVTNIKDPKGEATFRQLCAAIKLAKATADDIIESCRKEDGTVDWMKAKQEARLAIAS